MPPRSPETVLSAVVTVMRATPRKLSHNRASLSVVRVAAVIDEFPTHPASIEVANHRRGRGSADASRQRGIILGDSARSGYHAGAEDNAGHLLQRLAPLQRSHQAHDRFLPFPARDEIDCRFLFHDL